MMEGLSVLLLFVFSFPCFVSQQLLSGQSKEKDGSLWQPLSLQARPWDQWDGHYSTLNSKEILGSQALGFQQHQS